MKRFYYKKTNNADALDIFIGKFNIDLIYYYDPITKTHNKYKGKTKQELVNAIIQ